MNEYERAEEWYYKGVEGLYREGEEDIAKDGYWSCCHAVNNLKGRFLIGEKVIKEEGYWEDYVWYLKTIGIEI